MRVSSQSPVYTQVQAKRSENKNNAQNVSFKANLTKFKEENEAVKFTLNNFELPKNVLRKVMRYLDPQEIIATQPKKPAGKKIVG